MIKLYHGSNMQISQIDLAQCSPYKDFGEAYEKGGRQAIIELLKDQRTFTDIELVI